LILYKTRDRLTVILSCVTGSSEFKVHLIDTVMKLSTSKLHRNTTTEW